MESLPVEILGGPNMPCQSLEITEMQSGEAFLRLYFSKTQKTESSVRHSLLKVMDVLQGKWRSAKLSAE